MIMMMPWLNFDFRSMMVQIPMLQWLRHSMGPWIPISPADMKPRGTRCLSTWLLTSLSLTEAFWLHSKKVRLFFFFRYPHLGITYDLTLHLSIHIYFRRALVLTHSLKNYTYSSVLFKGRFYMRPYRRVYASPKLWKYHLPMNLNIKVTSLAYPEKYIIKSHQRMLCFVDMDNRSTRPKSGI